MRKWCQFDVSFSFTDDHITVVFFSGFQLATGKKGRFLYDLVRAGSQPVLGRLPAIACGMDIVLLNVSVVVPKQFDTGTTRPICCSGHLVPLFGHLAPSFEMDFNSSVMFYPTHIDLFYH